MNGLLLSQRWEGTRLVVVEVSCPVARTATLALTHVSQTSRSVWPPLELYRTGVCYKTPSEIADGGVFLYVVTFSVDVSMLATKPYRFPAEGLVVIL
jgi:hypothetical protein